AETVACGTAGDELALAVSVSQNVLTDVRSYCAAALPSVDEILHVRVNPAPGVHALDDAAHALQLCRLIGESIQTARQLKPRSRIHVFLSAPIAFAFFLGQRSRGWGELTLYEFEFEAGRVGGYLPALKLPRLAPPVVLV
ncbi:MAG: SAVED domain-containing protein, partial [Planctomycetes bacterium]|nr:SAVED domain-containing protein [Planctomycetota bacterium]